MIENKVVGAAIAKLRQAEGMTQQTLAACLNVSHQAVSKWEKGAALPDVLTLVELSRMFGVTLEQLLSGDVDFRLEGRAPAAAKPIELKLDYTDIHAKAEKAIEDAEFAAAEAYEAAYEAAAKETASAYETAYEAAEHTEEPKVNTEEKIDLDKVIEMAPFMSREALEEIVMRYNGKCSPKQLSKLAPFLSKDCLEKLVINCESDISWDTLRRLAPFLRKEFVDAFTTAAAKGEKYTGELGKHLKHGIKRVYNIGDQIYHDAIKPAIKKVIEPEKHGRHSRKAESAPSPAPVNRVSAARSRIFERALAEEKFDWIGEHIDQLDDDALRQRIASRALELGMNDWIAEYLPGCCDQEAIDNAILSGNWDFVAANIESADEDALALIADTAAAEGKWDWIAENIDHIAGCADAREAVIGHALKSADRNWVLENLEPMAWLGTNLGSLELTEADRAFIATKIVKSGSSDSWGWLNVHFDELDGEWADLSCAENAYNAKHMQLAMSIIENHLDGTDLTSLMLIAIEAGDIAFAEEIMEYNSGDLSQVCLTLANSGNLEKAIDIAEEYGADSDTVSALLDIAANQDNWDLIDRINDLID